MTDRRVTAILVLAFALGGCDKIQGLIDGGSKSGDPKAEEAKSDEKADAKADTKPEGKGDDEKADAKADDAKADDVKADDVKADDVKADDAKADDAKADAPPAEAAAAPAAGDQPCIVGHWEATDYLAQIERALRKDPQLKAMKYKSKSGTIGYVVEPMVDGKGTVKAKASDLKYKYGGKVQGIGVSLAVTMSGDITSTYELKEPSRIVIADPTENKMKVKARVTLKGLGTARDSSKVRHEFDGDFPYECTDTELKVWTVGTGKRPLKFKRLPDE